MIRFFDPQFELLDQPVMPVGAEVVISVGWDNPLTTLMRGEVTGVTLEARDSRSVELVVTGLDKMHRAMRGSKAQTFQNQSDADIAKQIAGDAGLTPDVDATGDPYDYLFQVNESDHQFLRNRARRLGFDFWVSDGKLHFKKGARPAGSIDATWGENLLRLKARMSSVNQVSEVQVRGWDSETQKEIVGKSTSNGFEPTDATFYSDHITKTNSSFGQKTRATGRFPVDTQGEADALAGSMRQRLSSAGLVVRGEIEGDPAVGAGTSVNLLEVGTRLAGEYLVTSVEHVFSANRQYRTRFTCSGPDPHELPDLLTNAIESGGQLHSGMGLSVGVVTNLNDPDNLGRVRVKLPTAADEGESFWARVVSPGAGAGRGMQSLPSVNDEVLVGFEHGDNRRAFVIGGLWSKKYKPPETTFHNQGAVQKHLWRSAKGHEVKIDDEGDGTLALTLKGVKSEAHRHQVRDDTRGREQGDGEGLRHRRDRDRQAHAQRRERRDQRQHRRDHQGRHDQAQLSGSCIRSEGGQDGTARGPSGRYRCRRRHPHRHDPDAGRRGADAVAAPVRREDRGRVLDEREDRRGGRCHARQRRDERTKAHRAGSAIHGEPHERREDPARLVHRADQQQARRAAGRHGDHVQRPGAAAHGVDHQGCVEGHDRMTG